MHIFVSAEHLTLKLESILNVQNKEVKQLKQQ